MVRVGHNTGILKLISKTENEFSLPGPHTGDGGRSTGGASAILRCFGSHCDKKNAVREIDFRAYVSRRRGEVPRCKKQVNFATEILCDFEFGSNREGQAQII